MEIRRFFVGGVLGGIVATIALFIGTSLLALPFPPLAIFQLLIAPVPGSIQSVVVDLFKQYAKYSAFVFSSAIYSLVYGGIAVCVGLIFKGDVQRNAKNATLVGTAITTVLTLGLQFELSGAFPAVSSLGGAIIAATLAVVVNLAYSKIMIHYTSPSPIIGTSQPQLQQPKRPLRRDFLKKVGIAVAVLVVAGVASKIGFSILSNQPVISSGTSIPNNPAPEPVGNGVPNIFLDPRLQDLVGSEVTDNRVFYRVDIDPIPPQLDITQWALKIHGKVNNPITLTANNFPTLSTMDEYATLECVSNTIYPPGALISNAKWTGFSLAALLNQAGVQPDAKYVIFRCGDGYTVGIPIQHALAPDAVLAIKMNDAVLPTEHGFPIRAIVPGLYGMMNAKWVTDIEVTDKVYLGYWQERGWSNDAQIRTTTILYYPAPNAQISGTTPIAGVAFAGDRGISKVEVSVDGGKTWNEATLKTPRSPYSWVLWAYEWTPTNSGPATIVARAYDSHGQLQDSAVNDPFPDGASGYPSNQVTVA